MSLKELINGLKKNSETNLSQTMNKVVLGEKIVQDGLPEICRKVASEGIVLLKNDGVLPLNQRKKVSVFGRVQYDYFYVGYGSGGDVNPPYHINLMDGLKENKKISVNESLSTTYEKWCKANPTKEGTWGKWPRYYDEMPLQKQMVENAEKESDVAMIVIGRAAGEDRENILEPGSYYLTDGEKKMLDLVTTAFEKTILILDTGNIMDLSWIEQYGSKIASVVLAWQGGMESGRALADILSGDVTPSAKLTDTIAYHYEDYPSSKNFGKWNFNNYVEDIFVGYRYFETFAKDKVQYPFGYGLSYTEFEMKTTDFGVKDEMASIEVRVTNTGKEFFGSEVIQVYVEAPQGKLGKSSRSLVAFQKTKELAPGESEKIHLVFPLTNFASYDDSGITGHKSAYILEEGNYKFYIGNNVRTETVCGEWSLHTLSVVEQLEQVSGVEKSSVFSRWKAVLKDGHVIIQEEEVPTRTSARKTIIEQKLPKAILSTGDQGYVFEDVKKGKITLDQFIAQLSEEELEAITRGEGMMDSKLGTKGNAGVFGGTTQTLRQKGVPVIITTDGPSGIRLSYYTCQLPCGTALASSWNPKIVYQLGEMTGKEMQMKGTDVLLAPGMNIHRDPLCGRNFEYYSEDPHISGKIASAMVRGIQSQGVSACPKHFACNNQETMRNRNDSRVSERALREIYLKGFEICVKESEPWNIMTSYNKVNGVWSHYNYDLITRVLRGEWKYQGNVVTDWWMQQDRDPDFKNVTNNAFRVRAQVDVLMPGSKRWGKKAGDNSLLSSYHKNGITLGEMQRCARNVLQLALKLQKHNR